VLNLAQARTAHSKISDIQGGALAGRCRRPRTCSDWNAVVYHRSNVAFIASACSASV
jgi:hypothetical protein